MLAEISITIKDEEKRLTKKFIEYESFRVDENEPIIKECIEETLENFSGTPDSIKVTIVMEMC